MKRDFERWFSTMKDSIAGWDFYADFPSAYRNVSKLKVELHILNSLIGSRNIEGDFKNLAEKYPEIMKAVPILLAKRESEIKIREPKQNFNFNFAKMNYSIDQYVLFMRNSGLFDLIQNHVISNLIDYVLGVEVGMDTNGRKNRIGHAMENLVESYLREAGLRENENYFKEMRTSDLERKFGIDLSSLNNNGKAEKRFDFVFNTSFEVFACECNFYSGGGSKLNETARSYKAIALESKGIKRFTFVWLTDGKGWQSAKHNLEETFDVLDTLYNIHDLENGIIQDLLDQGGVASSLLQEIGDQKAIG